MLQGFYSQFGFFGALLVSGIGFILFIFWMAGVAGIALPEDGGQIKDNRWQIVCAVLIPPYPIFWLLRDMYLQRKYMKEIDP